MRGEWGKDGGSEQRLGMGKGSGSEGTGIEAEEREKHCIKCKIEITMSLKIYQDLVFKTCLSSY